MSTALPAAPAPDVIGAGDLVYRSPVVPVFVRAQGAVLYDNKGWRYLDGEAANGTVGLGFDAGLLGDVMRRAAALPALPSFAESEQRLAVAARIGAMVSPAVGRTGRVAFELGGAQAIELAVRVVFSNTSARTIVVFEGAYHGRSAGTSQLSSSARYRRLITAGLDVVRLPYPDCARCPQRRADQDCSAQCLARVQRIGSDEMAGAPVGGGIAAVIFEPLLNVGGMAFPSARLMRHMTDHFRALGAFVVVDEIFTGLHRLGPRWGFELHGVQPDIVVGAKAMTNGIAALSFVWAREPLLDPANFPPGSHSNTFAGNPVALAAADLTLSRYETDGPALGRACAPLREAMATLADAPHVTRVDTVGWVSRVVLDAPLAAAVRHHALVAGRATPVGSVHGLLVASTGLAPDVVALHPPLTVSADEIDIAVCLLRRALAAI